MNIFSEKAAAGLEKCGIGFSSNPPSLLLAVSGGIDSMVMLYALKELSEKIQAKNTAALPPFFLSVVTVNHNIRPAFETEGDTSLVEACCAALGIPCVIRTILPGKIEELALERGGGIEEAARFMRYNLLEKEAAQREADFVLLAHNRDDQLETLLQRFLQGASAGISGKAAAGMARRRGIFCRPFLDISRCEIEAYAEKYRVPFREDSTNADAAYYRNNLRLHLVPLLNERFPGWDKAVLSGAEKALKTGAFIEEAAASIVWKPSMHSLQAVQTEAAFFFAAAFPVRIRALYAAVEKAGVRARVPYALLKAFAAGQKKVCGAGIELSCIGQRVYVQKEGQKEKNTAENKGPFFLNIRKPGIYELPFGTVKVGPEVQKGDCPAENKYGDVYTGPFKLPFEIRSFYTKGRIKTADGKHKSLKKIRSEWGIAPAHKELIPVIEYSGVPVCIWGQPLGYPTWYVKDSIRDEDDTVLLYFIVRKN
ncbi:tRNA lysidine(34) synthetase TilS [Treponema sp. HNW]|uniref:tRNA lysidine(34) synthetase TilS n=1 Tax=Treponema sp. HNW TaxID=3116654 RepID=UPI003D1475AB